MTKSVLQDEEWLSQSLALPILRMISDIKLYKRKEVITLQEQRQEGNEKDQKD